MTIFLETRCDWARRALKIATAVCLWLGCLPAPAAADNAALCLAQAMYWEAKSGGKDGMVAVGWVVLNRKNNPNFPADVCQVVREGGAEPPCQFSFWCDGVPETPRNEALWKTARALAERMLRNPPRDPTRGALYFHSAKISPPWKVPRRRTVSIGGHIFYR